MPVVTTQFTQGYALLIGVGNYLNPKLSLPVTANDATVLYKLFTNRDRAGYPEDHVKLLVNEAASTQGIIDGLDWLINCTANHPDSTAIVYFSGHGGTIDNESGTGKNYILLPNDFRSIDRGKSSISKELFAGKINQIKARKLMVFLDCCHAAGMVSKHAGGNNFVPSNAAIYKQLGKGKGRVIVASCRPDQYSYIFKGAKYSAFTNALIDALDKGGDNGNGYATVLQTLSVVDKMVTGATDNKQIPEYNLDRVEDFAICRINTALAQMIPFKKTIDYDDDLSNEFQEIEQIYLQWLKISHETIEVRGIRNQNRIDVPIEQVFIALKGDRTHPYERIQKGLALQRELNEVINKGEFTKEQRDAALWYLVAGTAPETSPIDVFSTNIYQTALLTIGEAYQQNDSLIILGDPGSGKTTLGRWLVHNMCMAKIAGKSLLEVRHHQIDPEIPAGEDDFLLGSVKLPILVRISEYAEDRLNRRKKGEDVRSLIEFMGHHSWLGTKPAFKKHLTPEMLNRYIVAQIENHEALIVLDGLDEIPFSNLRNEVLAEIHQFIENHINLRGITPLSSTTNAGNKLLVTSRIVGYYAAHLKIEIPHLTIEPMRDRAVDRFCDAWMTAVYEKEYPSLDNNDRTRMATNNAAVLKSEIHDAKRIKIRALASNPLLCSMIATAFFNGKSHLPQQRVKLYEAVVANMIDLWNLRMEKVFGTSFNEFEIYLVLEPIADFIHENLPTGLLPEGKLHSEALTQLALARKEDPENPSAGTQEMIKKFVRVLREDVGLLAARGEGVYGFLHLTFQEYLAARHLVRDQHKAVDEIVNRLENPRWQEPIRMALGHLSFNKPLVFIDILAQLLKIDQREDSILPRIAVLIAGALQEINEIPENNITDIIEILINAYANWDTQARSIHFKNTIERAINAIGLHGCEHLIEAYFTEVLVGKHKKLIPAVATLIAETDRYTETIAAALVQALPLDSESWQWPVHAALRKAVTPPDPAPPKILIKPAKDQRMSFYEQQLEQVKNPADQEKIKALIEKLNLQHERDLEKYQADKTTYDALYKAYVDAEMPLRCRLPTTALPFRQALENQPDLLTVIVNNGDWLRICIVLFGGLEDYRSADLNNEFSRMSAFLQLSDNERRGFEILFRDKWDLNDPVYHMAVYLDQYWPRLKALSKRNPVFQPQAIYKDSLISDLLLEALRKNQTPQSLVPKLYRILFGDPGAARRAEALICLMVMGADTFDRTRSFLRRHEEQALMTAVAEKLSQASSALSDPLSRSTEKIKEGLAILGESAFSGFWKEVVRSILSITIQRKIVLFNMNDLLVMCPADQRDYIYAEHLAQKVLGSSDDARYTAAVAADLFQDKVVSVETILNCFKSVAGTENISMPVYQYGWPVEKFPPHTISDGDIPIAVLNNISRIHPEISFFREAAFLRLKPILDKNPDLLPEIMLVNLGAMGENAGRISTLRGLYPLLPEHDVLKMVDALAGKLALPYYQARYLLRLTEIKKDDAIGLIERVRAISKRITSALEKVQVLEWLMYLDKSGRRHEHLATILDEIPKITEYLDQVAAYLRLFNALPSPSNEMMITPLLSVIEKIKAVETKADVLSILIPLFQNHRGASGRLLKMANKQKGWFRDKARRRFGPTLLKATGPLHTSPGQTEMWSPMVLAAQISDSGLVKFHSNQVSNLWEDAVKDNESLSRLIAHGRINRLKLTSFAARKIDLLMKQKNVTEIVQILELLEHPEPDTLLIVDNWLSHPDKEIVAYATLFISELQGVNAARMPVLLSFLESKKDLARHRVSRLICHPQVTPTEPTKLLSVMGWDLIRTYLKEIVYYQNHLPQISLTIKWMFSDLLFDSDEMLINLIEEVELESTDAEWATIGISSAEAVGQPVWIAMLDAIEGRKPQIKFNILVSICRLAYKKRKEKDNTVYRLPEEWWNDFLRFKDRLLENGVLNESLDAFRVNFSTPLALVLSVKESLESFGDADMITRIAAIEKLADERCKTSFYKILRLPNDQIRQRFEEIAANNLYVAIDYRRLTFSTAITQVYQDPALFKTLLTWLWQRLEKSVNDGYLESVSFFLLIIIAETADNLEATFINWPHLPKLKPLLVEAAKSHNSYPGRAAAIKLLMHFRVDTEIVEVLKIATRDVFDVHNAVFDTASRFNKIDERVFPELVNGLYDESAMTAFTIGKLLTAVGRSDYTAPARRREILKALTDAARDARSQRLIHFSYADAVLPDIPRLDHELFKMAMQVAGLSDGY
ncbi:MAG: caspase family protein [Bacteroidota bacterium]